MIFQFFFQIIAISFILTAFTIHLQKINESTVLSAAKSFFLSFLFIAEKFASSSVV